MGATRKSDSAMVADLNDLLQLDRDAVQAYTLAEKGLESESYRTQIAQFKRDHQRHIDELTALITARGGDPMPLPHLSSSPFKLAAQGLGDLGSDTAVLLAFKANERLSRDKYQRAAEQGYPPEVQAVVQRGAADESTHYEWVQATLERLGAGAATTVGKAEQTFEAGHASLAGAMERGEKRLLQSTEAMRARLSDALGSATDKAGELSGRLGAGGMRNVWIALGVGLVAAQLGRRGSAGRRSTSGRYAPAASGRRATYSPGERDLESRDVGMPAL